MKRPKIPSPTQSFYKELMKLNWKQLNASDEQKSLLEPLELVAVHLGIKKAFLGGVPNFNDPIYGELKNFLPKYGFKVIETHFPVIYGTLRSSLKSDISNELFEFHLKDAEKYRAFWAFIDPDIEEIIQKGVKGEASLSAALTYPECCLNHFYERNIQLDELYLKECTTALEARSFLQLENPHMYHFNQQSKMDLANSILKYPFNHFTACPRCLEHENTPAAEINDKFRITLKSLNMDHFLKVIDYSKKFYKYMWGLS